VATLAVGCKLTEYLTLMANYHRSQLTGINAIIYYAPTIFATVGIEPFIATAVVGVVNFLSTFIGL
jgi:hypothetical protein